METRSKFKLTERQLRIHFSNESKTKTMQIAYQLYDHDLMYRWLALFHIADYAENLFGPINFTGQILDDEENIVTMLNLLILKINTYLIKNKMDGLIIESKVYTGIPQQTLNYLHRYFEINSTDMRFNHEMVNCFKLLNIFIHKMENFSDGKKNNCVMIDISPYQSKYLKFELEDYSLFSLDWTWGQLLLNYGLRGVPTAHAFLNNSIPRPQHSFTGGCTLSFVEDSIFKRYEELNQWLIKNNLEVGDPQCTLGTIPLGEMIEPTIPRDDESRLKFLLQFKEFINVDKVEYIGPKDFVNIQPSDEEIMGKYDFKK